MIAAVLRAFPADARHRTAPPRLDVGDDAAVTADGLALTVDTLVEGVHFDARLSAEDVGYKSLAVSVSDLASVGAVPQWALLSLALPDADAAWTTSFAEGLALACGLWGVRLLGGDTVRTSGPRVISVTAGGQCTGTPMSRQGARPGDAIWVTGTLGQAGEGWSSATPSDEALAALRRPCPPVAFALDLHTSGVARAAMDLSDGLARDLPRLCQASGVGARIDADALPGQPPASADGPDLRLSGGEDYQLLFTTAAEDATIAVLGARHRTRVTRIGTIVSGHGPTLLDGTWPPPAFAHFPTAREAR